MIELTPSPAIDPVWVSAIASSVMAIVAIVAIILTYRQVRLTAFQIRETAQREAQNSEERTRPSVGLDVVPSVAGAPVFDLVIENHGNATARAVSVILTDGVFGPQSDGDEIGPALGRFFEETFDLPPGAHRRVFWRFARGDGGLEMGAPVAAELRVTYSWEPGAEQSTRHYEERLRYDLREYPKLTPVPAQGSRDDSDNNDPVVQLRNAVHTLRAIAIHLGALRR